MLARATMLLRARARFIDLIPLVTAAITHSWPWMPHTSHVLSFFTRRATAPFQPIA